MSARAWTPLSPRLGELLRPHLAEVVAEVVDSIPAEVPDYARPLEGSFGKGVRRGVTVALTRFLDLPGTEDPALGTMRQVYVELGRGEHRQGRSLTVLLAAYRVGARVACQRFTELAVAEGVPAQDVLPLVQAVFVYIDEISAASAEGYAQAQSAQAGTRQRLVRELIDLLLRGGADSQTANELAAAVGWTLPAQLSVVVVPGPALDELAVRLWPVGLSAEVAGSTVAVVPAFTDLHPMVGARFAVVGPVRPWQQAAESLRLAQALVAAVTAGAEPGSPAEPPARVVSVDDNLVGLLLRRELTLVDDLAAGVLAPLDAVKESTRERLAETLLAWLTYRGERGTVAAALHVHPQTVGYRLGQLRELFGDALEDPDRRFALELVLRSRRTDWH
jgi:hypothetical protein